MNTVQIKWIFQDIELGMEIYLDYNTLQNTDFEHGHNHKKVKKMTLVSLFHTQAKVDWVSKLNTSSTHIIKLTLVLLNQKLLNVEVKYVLLFECVQHKVD